MEVFCISRCISLLYKFQRLDSDVFVSRNNGRMCGAVVRHNVRIAGITHQLGIFKRGGCNLAGCIFFTHKSGGTEIDVADLLGELSVLFGSECTRIGSVIN